MEEATIIHHTLMLVNIIIIDYIIVFIYVCIHILVQHSYNIYIKYIMSNVTNDSSFIYVILYTL